MPQQTLIFHNPGEIDIRGACIAGLSAKESDSAIGYFGTGLKYSIACILRWGGSITIYSGSTAYCFEAQDLRFRDRKFKQVCMSENLRRNIELGFTIEYGKNWQAWQVFRELYANARDEGGGVRLESNFTDHFPGEGTTRIMVSGVEDLISAYYQRDEIILPADKTWAQETASLKINLAPSRHLYYRDVRVADFRAGEAALFTWNFLKDIELTEDRTIKSNWIAQDRASVFIRDELTDESALEQIFIASRQDRPTFEKSAWSWMSLPTARHSCSQAFANVACRMYERDPVGWKALRPLVADCNAELVRSKSHRLSPREQAMLARAIELCSKFGFAEEIKRVSIEVTDLGTDTLGLCEHSRIYLSPRLFDQGTKQVVSTLYEELFHYKTDQQDLTYSMQTELFNIIISLNEELHNVIC
jgi:hypothetical protein